MGPGAIVHPTSWSPRVPYPGDVGVGVGETKIGRVAGSLNTTGAAHASTCPRRRRCSHPAVGWRRSPSGTVSATGAHALGPPFLRPRRADAPFRVVPRRAAAARHRSPTSIRPSQLSHGVPSAPTRWAARAPGNVAPSSPRCAAPRAAPRRSRPRGRCLRLATPTPRDARQ